MPLILAVEPDRLRIADVTALIRGRPRTELIIAESATAALSAIAARIPDVLLVSPKLSQEDQGRIADCLKGLGRAAAHVKMLTTPVPAPVNTTRPETAAANPPHNRLVPASAVATRPIQQTAGKPIQDEWGFFDPALCGFSALSNLEEQPAGAPTKPAPQEHVLVRVIPY